MCRSTEPIVNAPVTRAELECRLKDFARKELANSLMHLQDQIKKDVQAEVVNLLDAEGALSKAISSVVAKKIESMMTNATKKVSRTSSRAEMGNTSSFRCKLKGRGSRNGNFMCSGKKSDPMRKKSLRFTSVQSEEGELPFIGRLSEFIGEKAPTTCLGSSTPDQAAAVLSPAIGKNIEWMKQERLACFDGDVATAFQMMPETELFRSSDFTPLDQLTEHGVEICKNVDLLTGAAGQQLDLAYLFPALYGSNDFMRRFRERRGDTAWSTVLRKPSALGAPFAAAATLRCMIKVPVLGPKPYSEKERIVFAKSYPNGSSADDDVRVLISQMVGTVDLGRLGVLRTETATFFSQRAGGKVMMTCIAVKPTSWFASHVVEGYRQGIEDFHQTAKQFLGELAYPAVSTDTDTLPCLLKDGSRLSLRATGSDETAATSTNKLFAATAAERSCPHRLPEAVLPTAAVDIKSLSSGSSRLAPLLDSFDRRSNVKASCTGCCFIGLDALIRLKNLAEQKLRH